MIVFNAKKVKDQCVLWIKEFFEKNGAGCNAVVGISGGKDSSVAAALCVEALGKERVIGVLMPQGEQHDIDMAYMLVNFLGIKHYVVNIKDAVDGILKNMPEGMEVTSQTIQNIPPRVRMTTLYAISQSNNGRVVTPAIFRKTGLVIPPVTVILWEIFRLCQTLQLPKLRK